MDSSSNYLQSTLFISSNDTEPRDDGIYTCQVILTVARTDNFTASDNSRVLSTGKHTQLYTLEERLLQYYDHVI